MKSRKVEGGVLSALLVLGLAALMLTACGAPAAPPAAAPVVQTVVVRETAAPVVQTVVAAQTVVVPQTVVAQQTVVVEPTAAPNPEMVIEGVEPNAEVTLWTFWLSPTFDDYIKETIARFEATYPGVKVNWEDHQATFQDDLRNSFAAGNAPDVINLSVGEGWVSDYATQGLLLPLDDAVPQSVKDLYFEGLWNQQLVDGVNYQFPWYQGISVELINTKIYSDGAGLKLEDFPTTVDGLPELCQTIKDKTGTLCTIRLTVNDLLSQMVYEGGVDILSDDGTSCTFDSADGVAWLQMYVDMVEAGTVDRTVLVTDQDRVGLDAFIGGNSAFYQTGPNLIREVRSNNPGLYGYLAAVKADTEYPNASIALAQFFTNPQSMLEFAKVVAVYPSTPLSYDDPFFAADPIAIEDSAKPIAKDIVSTYADIVPTVPNKADVNEAVLQAVQSALFDNVSAQDALSAAVEQCNTLITQ